MIVLSSAVLGAEAMFAFIGWASSSPLLTMSPDDTTPFYFWIVGPMARFGADTGQLAQGVQLFIGAAVSVMITHGLFTLRNYSNARRSSRITAS
jgi:hypothetical protein